MKDGLIKALKDNGYTIKNFKDVTYDENYKQYTFELEEVKGWLFGFWENYPYDVKSDKSSLFAQPLDNIDKFKPSRSVYSYDTISQDEFDFYLKVALEVVAEPILFDEELAWYRDNSFGSYPKNREELKLKIKELREND